MALISCECISGLPQAAKLDAIFCALAEIAAGGGGGGGDVLAGGTLTNNSLVIGNGGSTINVTPTGTGVLTALGVNVGSAGAFVTFNGAGGTPSSLTLTNATGLPVSTGITGLGAGVATFLATPSSANLAAAVTGETGSGALVFATSPALVTPDIGTPSAGVLSACTVDGTNLVGYRGAPQNSQSANYVLVLADAGKCIFHPSGGGAGDTFTIPANGSVAFPIGTIVEFINLDSNSVSIAITTDTLTFLPAGTTGTRTLAQYGRASAEKVTSTQWVISGNSALT